jgi:cytochrome c-type biogenesis protein CcmH
MRIFYASLSLFLVALLAAHPAQAQPPAPDEPTYRIAKQLNCPTCAGRNLADCPTETCAQWKAEIKTQLDAGKSAEEVLAYFQARFGPTVLQEPPKSGVTAPLWAAPAGAALVFLASVGLVMWRAARRSAATPAPAAAEHNDPFIAELERQVRAGE